MTNNNDFAERLQNWIADPYHRLTDDNPDPSWLLDEALAAERRAGADEERERIALLISTGEDPGLVAAVRFVRSIDAEAN